MEHKLLKEEEKSVDVFVDELENIEVALKEAELHSVPKNVAVLGTLSFYKLESYEKYKSFIQWIKQNSIVDAPKIHMADLISIYDKVFENTPKSIFVSMQFCDSTADTYQTIKDIRDAIKRESGVEINLIKVDEHHDGYSGDIYERIIEEIKKSALVIADLSYGNRNVHHEIGLAQGMGKKVLLLYKLRDAIDARQEIEQTFEQINFTDEEKEIYQKFANSICALLYQIKDSLSIEKDSSIIIGKLRVILRDNSLEEYITNVTTLISIFVKSDYRYYNNKVEVYKVKDFYEFFLNQADAVKEIILNNLYGRIGNIPVIDSAFDEELPFN